MALQLRLSGTVRQWAPWLLILIAGMVIAWMADTRFRRIEGMLERVSAQVEDTSNRLRAAELAAEQARRQAERAEEYSRAAVETRQHLEAVAAAAEERARALESESTEVRRELELTQEELARLREEREKELNRLQRALQRIAETRRTRGGLVMNLDDETVKFDFDRAEIKPQYREVLSRIAGILLTASGYRVQIYGHTDDIGTEAYNQSLSERRAQAVRDYLVAAGIGPQIISVKGFGKANPIFPGTSPEARARNRRVEIGIIDTVISYDRLAEP